MSIENFLHDTYQSREFGSFLLKIEGNSETYVLESSKLIYCSPKG
jgi:hypothetical protein